MIGLLNALGVSLYWTTASIHAEMRVSNAIARVREGLRRQREQRKDDAFTRALKADAKGREVGFLRLAILWCTCLAIYSLLVLAVNWWKQEDPVELALMLLGAVSNGWLAIDLRRDLRKAKVAREACDIEAAMNRMAKDCR